MPNRFSCPTLLALLLLAGGVAQAQPATAPRYRNLVMEGGGVRGIAYGGALQELEKQGILQGIERVGGTSAGAIQAALLAVGYSPDELVDRKTQRPDLTLGELHALAQQHPGQYRDLYTTGTNLTLQRSQVFSYETHPHLRVADAVRISMSIPLYYRAVLLDEQGRVVPGKPAAGQAVQVLVDGGLLANYPLTMFDDARYLNTVLATDTVPATGPVVNPQTLGLRLDRAEQIALDTAATGRQALARYDINSFPGYMGALYNVALENLNPAQPADWPRTISISTVGISPKVKRMPLAQKQLLVESGRKGAQAFFQMRNEE